MEDESIIELYFDRDERALRETEAKYGPLCRQVANNILGSPQDAEECVNDVYLALWDDPGASWPSPQVSPAARP